MNRTRGSTLIELVVVIAITASATDPSHVAKFVAGLIDEVRIYNRALSKTEVCSFAGQQYVNAFRSREMDIGGLPRAHRSRLKG